MIILYRRQKCPTCSVELPLAQSHACSSQRGEGPSMWVPWCTNQCSRNNASMTMLVAFVDSKSAVSGEGRKRYGLIAIMLSDVMPYYYGKCDHSSVRSSDNAPACAFSYPILSFSWVWKGVLTHLSVRSSQSVQLRALAKIRYTTHFTAKPAIIARLYRYTCPEKDVVAVLDLLPSLLSRRVKRERHVPRYILVNHIYSGSSFS